MFLLQVLFAFQKKIKKYCIYLLFEQVDFGTRIVVGEPPRAHPTTRALRCGKFQGRGFRLRRLQKAIPPSHLRVDPLRTNQLMADWGPGIYLFVFFGTRKQHSLFSEYFINVPTRGCAVGNFRAHQRYSWEPAVPGSVIFSGACFAQ